TSADGTVAVEAEGWQQLPDHPELALVLRALRHFQLGGGCEVVVGGEAPRGSGLGGSSALMVALCAAVTAWQGRPRGGNELVRIASALEAQVLGTPTGRQDHYAAAYGGINALWFDVEGDRVEQLDPTGALATALSERLVLCDSGHAHHSGAQNWPILRAYIDGDPAVRAAIAGIRRAAEGVRAALSGAPDWTALAGWIDEEWRYRRQLASGVSTSRIEGLLRVGRGAGALAGKVCGAGGGGCLLLLAPPDRREAVEQALAQAGARPLPARIRSDGLRVCCEL
ncbi:MAG TPA: hypothetical protein VIL95_05350, partial [Bacillota bacterium]